LLGLPRLQLLLVLVELLPWLQEDLAKEGYPKLGLGSARLESGKRLLGSGVGRVQNIFASVRARIS
jgi:hypothetical protein